MSLKYLLDSKCNKFSYLGKSMTFGTDDVDTIPFHKFDGNTLRFLCSTIFGNIQNGRHWKKKFQIYGTCAPIWMTFVSFIGLLGVRM